MPYVLLSFARFSIHGDMKNTRLKWYTVEPIRLENYMYLAQTLSETTQITKETRALSGWNFTQNMSANKSFKKCSDATPTNQMIHVEKFLMIQMF
jgi:hypothetical protein